MAYGQDGHVGLSFQNSYGTSNVDSMDFLPISNETLTEPIESLMSEALISRYEEPDDYEGMHSVTGDLVTEVHPANVGKLLFAWAGQESVSYNNSCYSHLFLPLTDDWDAEKSALPPCTIEVYRDTGSAYGYYDCLCNQLVFEITQGTLYKVTASWIGANFSWLAKQTAAYETGSYFSWDTVSLSLAGSGIDDVENLTITLNNNLAGKAYLDGNKTYGRILRDGNRTIEISGTMLLDGDTEARNYRGRTQQRLVMTATDPATVMLAHHQLEIDIPQMLYTEFPANIAGTGLINVGFAAKGKYDTTSDYAVQFTLVNTKDAYD